MIDRGCIGKGYQTNISRDSTPRKCGEQRGRLASASELIEKHTMESLILAQDER